MVLMWNERLSTLHFLTDVNRAPSFWCRKWVAVWTVSLLLHSAAPSTHPAKAMALVCWSVLCIQIRQLSDDDDDDDMECAFVSSPILLLHSAAPSDPPAKAMAFARWNILCIQARRLSDDDDDDDTLE